ncbi:hypothetical protein FM105_00155 [Brevibacterium yomogidense]|uniref:Uncharacterized protein n=2 Tax=Brevibacterium yomogidense TaxID=946573 RepID=A0A1X6WTI3_9MICO|nr:hypothetical protein FM105_00155 [Brevibacterium yomogidense]
MWISKVMQARYSGIAGETAAAARFAATPQPKDLSPQPAGRSPRLVAHSLEARRAEVVG